ncbi:MAG: phosphotransferase [Proteobacteria bacterium]|nr:phosphotransferase [Pseudomonadota bacterium]
MGSPKPEQQALLNSLEQSLEALGLPKPSRVSGGQGLGPKVTHRLHFGSPQADRMLHRISWDAGYDPLKNEHAAVQFLTTTRLVPCQLTYQLLELRPSAAIATIVPGTGGDQVIHRQKEMTKSVCEVIGQVMRRLSAAKSNNWGTRASGGRFVPLRSCWRSEWWKWVRWEANTASSHGTFDERHSGLLESIKIQMEALDEVQQFSLVHRDLKPDNMLFKVGKTRFRGRRATEADSKHRFPVLKSRPTEPVGPGVNRELELTGVVDWSGSLLGDPIVEWVLPMFLPSVLLTSIIHGFGASRAREIFTPEAIQRLDVYCMTRILGAFRRAGQLTRFVSEAAGAQALQEANALFAMAQANREEKRLSTLLGTSKIEDSPGRTG